MSEEGPRERWAIALTVGAILFVIYVLFAFKHFISMGLIVSNYTAVQLEAMILSPSGIAITLAAALAATAFSVWLILLGYKRTD